MIPKYLKWQKVRPVMRAAFRKNTETLSIGQRGVYMLKHTRLIYCWKLHGRGRTEKAANKWNGKERNGKKRWKIQNNTSQKVPENKARECNRTMALRRNTIHVVTALFRQ